MLQEAATVSLVLGAFEIAKLALKLARARRNGVHAHRRSTDTQFVEYHAFQTRTEDLAKEQDRQGAMVASLSEWRIGAADNLKELRAMTGDIRAAVARIEGRLG